MRDKCVGFRERSNNERIHRQYFILGTQYLNQLRDYDDHDDLHAGRSN